MNYKRFIPAVVATLLVLFDGFFLSGLNIITPSLLAVAVLLVLQYPVKHGWMLALWLGFLMDSMSMQPFGAYMILSAVMFLIAYIPFQRGLEMARFLNVSAVIAALVGVQFIWRIVLLLPHEWLGENTVLLAQYAFWQALFTMIVGFLVIRALKV